ncbi:hypothetical protein E2C01_025551 [Portunus trituberculatus]|uniref:Uncharacterized protein n=1 Tax=Portunus trituberculatus TaxID=210409 RepID=A0A5B7EGR1_PORTR|nr:hypothetical protein [Portunus trituberculatus]
MAYRMHLFPVLLSILSACIIILLLVLLSLPVLSLKKLIIL